MRAEQYIPEVEAGIDVVIEKIGMMDEMDEFTPTQRYFIDEVIAIAYSHGWENGRESQ